MTAGRFDANEADQSNIEVDLQSQAVTFHGGHPGAPQLHRYEIGETLGEAYVLQQLIGRGGMGVVYRARHKIMDQLYAVKLLAPGQINDQSWRRFEVEGKALARLKHANIVTIYNMGVDRGQFPYFVMDWLPGVSLADRLQATGAIEEAETISIFLQVCAGLSSAHKSGIIHRDIKPGNIMLVPTQSGLHIKIVDFGMARLNTQQALTAIGEVFGSPLYMSPEQCRGEPMDARSDIYSLGCSIFECLTGRAPFRGESAIATIQMHQEDNAPTLAAMKENDDTEYSAAIEAVVAKCLCKEADHRYQSVDQLALDLERIQVGKSIGRGARAKTKTEPDLSQSFRLFEKDESQQIISGNTTTSFWSRMRNDKAAFIIVPVLLIVLVAGGITTYFSQQNKKLPPTVLKLASEFNKGPTTGNIGVDGFFNPTQVLEELKKCPRVSQGLIIKNGQKLRCFDLSNVDIARLWTFEDQTMITTKGRVSYPADKPICLRLSMVLNSYPQYITKLNPDDISFLRLSELEPSDYVLGEISGWTRLETLMFDGGTISDTALKKLDQIKNLKNLIFKKAIFNGPSLVKLKCLGQLTALRFEDCSNVSSVLKNLPVMPLLRHMDLGGSNRWITIEAVRGASRQKYLTSLIFDEKKTRSRKEASIVFDIVDVEHNESDLPPLKFEETTKALASMPNLKRLTMSQPEPAWSKAQIHSFALRVPAARINKWVK